ncbi:MAG: SurA N-terminal domain-containing protein [Bacteroidetes bacterium]|nr:SurA N-terminal domain-containing protein [Bacteroidota bacterium]
MSVLEKIRSRTGLLVGIVGLALGIFILQSLLGSGASLFKSDDMLVGEIAGDKIEAQEFRRRVDEQIAKIMKANAQNPDFRIDENTHQQIVESVWNQMVNDRVIKVQYEKLGVAVSDDELVDLMLVHPHQYLIQQLSDPKTGQLRQDLAKPDGTIDVSKLNQLISQLPPEQEMAWKNLEDAVKEYRTAEKYNNLIKKGVYVTTAEAKDAFVAQSKQMSVSYVMKRYNTVSDSAVKVSEDDIKNYYTKHQNDYKVDEASRKIEYIAFDVLPSKEDYEALQKDAQRIADDFRKRTNTKDDSVFIAQESENGVINIANFTKKNMPVADSTVFTAPKGTVFGPFTEGTFLKVYKLEDVRSVADSAKVRHILIALQSPKLKQQRTPEAAKRTADSLLTLLKEKKANFDTLVKTVSDDLGSIDKGGDYGWFDENKQFVEPFKNAGLLGTKGNISVVPTQFGYHIIEVLDVSKTRHTSYSLSMIDKLIAPSNKTSEEYYKQASDFAGKNRTLEAFNKAVDTEKLNKRLADNIRESDKNLPGLEGAKDLVRWIYKSKKGDVAEEPFAFKDRYIVPVITGVKEKGIAPLDEVREDVTAKAIRAKKAEQFIEEFKKAGTTVDAVAAKLTLTPEKMENVTFGSFNVAGVGREDALIGAAAGLKQGATSKPMIGENGVFMVNVGMITAGQLPKDFKNKQKEMEQMVGSRVDYEIYGILKEKANIEDHRAKYDF